ncbi:MAG: LCP family protein, partial [Lachnospiraceae bacterium]|nr:LCP family protein [Lachnospiraceae bacterium]
AARFIHSSVNADPSAKIPDDTGEKVTPTPTEEPTQAPVYTDKTAHRYEDYVTNYLLFGLEQINGGSRSDAMLLVSLNTKDNTIKLTSFMRDTYVTIPGHNRNKLNAAYGYGGPDLLVDVLENTYDIEIEGYASVNFTSLEAIVDRLGGIDLELGEAEAKYLRNTNYISKPENRTVQAGMNHMNGNQVLGYCRVRKVSTLGGANNDYGRTVRHRRVIKAIIEQFKNSSYLDMLSIAKDCLGYLETNVTEDQIADALYKVVENKMFESESMRLPADNYFRDSGRAGINGITYALVIDDYIDKNIEAFHQFLFLDPTPTPTGEATPSPSEGSGP